MRTRGVLASLFALAAMSWMAGCSDTDDVVQTDGATIQAEVEATGPALAESVDTATGAADAMAAMMDLIDPSPGLAAAQGPVTCPETFQLENGLSGTCSVSETGVVTIAFEGVIARGVSVTGTLTGTPSATQPPSGARYDVVLDAEASAPDGSQSIDVTGFVVLNESWIVTDYGMTMTVVIRRTGRPTFSTSSNVTPAAISVAITGPLGNTVSVSILRGTMTGEIAVNGRSVASVVIEGGCVTVDFTSPDLEDGTLCREV